MAAPTGMRSTTPPKWVNPCGIDPDKVLSPEEAVDIPSIPHQELYTNIQLQSQLAINDAENAATIFVEKAFKDPEFPKYSKDLQYKWLPVVPDMTDEHLKTINVSDALRKSYEYLQYYAVGLEQVVMDQVLHEGEFLEMFRTLEGKLRQVLCEIQLAMLEMDVKQNKDVAREIMAQEYRDMNFKTARDLRDWIILRDYMTSLNYIHQVFSYFKGEEKAS